MFSQKAFGVFVVLFSIVSAAGHAGEGREKHHEENHSATKDPGVSAPKRPVASRFRLLDKNCFEIRNGVRVEGPCVMETVLDAAGQSKTVYYLILARRSDGQLLVDGRYRGQGLTELDQGLALQLMDRYGKKYYSNVHTQKLNPDVTDAETVAALGKIYHRYGREYLARLASRTDFNPLLQASSHAAGGSDPTGSAEGVAKGQGTEPSHGGEAPEQTKPEKRAEAPVKPGEGKPGDDDSKKQSLAYCKDVKRAIEAAGAGVQDRRGNLQVCSTFNCIIVNKKGFTKVDVTVAADGNDGIHFAASTDLLKKIDMWVDVKFPIEWAGQKYTTEQVQACFQGQWKRQVIQYTFIEDGASESPDLLGIKSDSPDHSVKVKARIVFADSFRSGTKGTEE